jgi:hypothetical protein
MQAAERSRGNRRYISLSPQSLSLSFRRHHDTTQVVSEFPAWTAHVFSIDRVQRKPHTCRGVVLAAGRPWTRTYRPARSVVRPVAGKRHDRSGQIGTDAGTKCIVCRLSASPVLFSSFQVAQESTYTTVFVLPPVHRDKGQNQHDRPLSHLSS